ncbi:uncharacterized protein H6S33_005137 [Morchella sextelata]|uniref:uncharacterized protein n=1 Tax=Morchella sextelata TaxID=1174677 RepID=UPI001D049B5A|nr:uncharacterized protein H6S33_005137 [Morchella sextelata]KAH0605155.1 hypothetical protein H6S33_005137 [Morchella sextelata]
MPKATRKTNSGIKKAATTVPAVTVVTRRQARLARERARDDSGAELESVTNAFDMYHYVTILIEEVMKALGAERARKTSMERPLFFERGKLYLDVKSLEASASCEGEWPVDEQLQKVVRKTRTRLVKPARPVKGISILNIQRVELTA